MAPKRIQLAPFALATDGGVLLNARAQLDPKLVSLLARALAVRVEEVFVGTRLPAAQLAKALGRLDDAAAELEARIHGSSPEQSSASSRSRAGRKKS